MAQLALKLNWPIFFAAIEKQQNKYKIIFSLITETPSKYNSIQLIDIYCKALETSIKKNPTSYLWSHNRWKHSFSKFDTISGAEKFSWEFNSKG